MESTRSKTFGAGLGWREAQRRGLGTAQVPKTEKRLNRCDSAVVILPGWSILVRHHYRDGGLWVVHVEGAAMGNKFD